METQKEKSSEKASSPTLKERASESVKSSFREKLCTYYLMGLMASPVVAAIITPGTAEFLHNAAIHASVNPSYVKYYVAGTLMTQGIFPIIGAVVSKLTDSIWK